MRDARQHGLEIGLLEMLIEERLAGPVLVEEEERRIVQRLVKVVVEAPGILAARVHQGEQFLPDQPFLARLGFDLRDHGKRF